MATATIKRHSTEPAPQLAITSGSSAYDLSNHTAKFIAVVKTTLEVAIDNIETTIELPAAMVDIIEDNDVLLIEHERMEVDTPLPTQPPAGATVTVTVIRGFDIAATAAEVIASIDASVFVVTGTAEFDISIDGDPSATVDISIANCAGNVNMADLVTTVDTQVGADYGVGCTVSNQNGKLVFTSDTTGVNSAVVVSAPNAFATDELGIVAGNGLGEAAQTTDNIAHAAGTVLRIIKVERTAVIESPSTAGIVSAEWADGDTDRVSEMIMEFEVLSSTGRQFTVPNDESFSVVIVADFNDQALD